MTMTVEGSTQMSAEILGNLKRAVIEYDPEGAASWARQAVEGKIEPLKAIDVLTDAIRQVGDDFGSGVLWLPELVGAADAMQAALPILEEELKKTGGTKKSLGTVVVATVYGDIHTIGKTLVATLLTASGFEVHDVGANVAAEELVEAVKKYKADILAMSALMTVTAREQKKVVDMLKEAGIREEMKVMVGGGAVTEAFAESIGADGYDPTAAGAVGLAKKLIGVE